MHFGSQGHEVLTNEAVEAAVKDLPPQLNWVRHFVRETMVGSVYRDMEDVFTRGHWTRAGQKHHFMRYDGDSAGLAYKNAVTWIRENSRTAATRFREIWQKKRGYVHPVYIHEPLGNALHALQDSYAEGHVTRRKEGNTYVIVDVLKYDRANKEAQGTWPGHKTLDKRWKSNDLGKEAVIAGRELIRIVVKSSLVKMDIEFGPKYNSLWQTFASVFLVSRL